MKSRLLFFLFFICCNASIIHAQKFTTIAKVHYAGFSNKQIEMLGFDIGERKMCFSVSAGVGSGIDKQFLPVENIDDEKEIQNVKESQTIFPVNLPRNSYLESCNSNYKIQQLRLGFIVYIRKNDTLDRHPCTGPHFGVEAMFSKIIESQTATYKSDFDEMRYVYSGTNKFYAIGAGTHFGWQFAFCKEHLYIDLRGVIPFYYPFMTEPNLNSPFAGNKWELQASIGWHFYKTTNQNLKDSDKDKIRQKI